MANCEHIMNDNAPPEFRFSVNVRHTGPLDGDDVFWLCGDCYDRLKGIVLTNIIEGAVKCLHLQRQKKQS